MIKITKIETSKEAEYKFEDLKPGTVFKWNSGIVSLKLICNKCIHLMCRNKNNWFTSGDGSVETYHRIVEVYGMIDEIIVKEIQ